MKTYPEKKIAAVLFTDIEGYTLVSNQNQQRGLEMARIHREVIQFCVAIYGGDCINFYGDGSLSLFRNAKDAVSCAIRMQHRFRFEESIPVRIGIHLGEVVCDAGSAYGDAVNIASRIQNIAPKGGILVSRAVYEGTGRPRSFHMVGIGSENLKNIPSPIRLYYVDHPDVLAPEKGEVHRRAVAKSEVKPGIRTGFAFAVSLLAAVITTLAAIFIDTNQHMITPNVYEAKLAVMPFDNRTENPEDSAIGDIAADLIIKSLRGLPGTDVVSYTFLNSYEPVKEAGFYDIGKVPRVTHAQNLILGKYFMEGDSIVFVAELINLVTRKYIHIWEPQKSHCSEPMAALGRLESAIKGYWASKDQQPQRKPNFEAYDYYIKALDVWEEEDSLALEYLDKSIHHDSLFLDAYLLKTDWYYNRAMYAEFSAWNKLIFQKFPLVNLDERARNSIQYNKADLEGDLDLAYKLFRKEYELQPDDLYNNITMAVLSMEYMNNPDSTLKVIGEINPEEIDYTSCAFCLYRLDMQVRALLDKGQHEKARQLLSLYPSFDENNSHTQLAVRTLIANHDTASLARMMNRLRFILDTPDFANLQYKAGRDALVMGQDALAGKFLARAMQYHEGRNLKVTMEIHDLLGNHSEAFKQAKRRWEEKKHPVYQARMALYAAHAGNTRLARDLLRQAEASEDAYYYGSLTYDCARVYAALGEKMNAVGKLEQAIHQGRKFGKNRYHWDPAFRSLQDDAIFQQAIRV